MISWRKAGIEYVADWVLDEQPVPTRTRTGEIVFVPYPSKSMMSLTAPFSSNRQMRSSSVAGINLIAYTKTMLRRRGLWGFQSILA